MTSMSRKRILIVDDEPDILIALQFLMEQQDYNVRTAESGEFALDLTAQKIRVFCQSYCSMCLIETQNNNKGLLHL